MTPKEKAENLYLRFKLKLPLKEEVDTLNEYGEWSYDPDQLAKDHCLICVDEIIKALIGDKIPHVTSRQKIDFFQSVRKEIEKI